MVVLTGEVLQNQPIAKQKCNEDLTVFFLNREKEVLQTVAVALIRDSVFPFQFKCTFRCFTPTSTTNKNKADLLLLIPSSSFLRKQGQGSWSS